MSNYLASDNHLFFQKSHLNSLCSGILIVILASLLASCANIQRVAMNQRFSPQDQEPRVKFIDEDTVKVETSSIDAIEPEIVIKSYERLLTRGNPQIRQEALHRLADLTMRLAEAKLGVDDTSGATEAVTNASFSKAIALYQTLLSEFPEYQALDEVKYQLARAHSMNSDPESSLNILNQIAVTHVESLSYVESQFRRGEAYFSRRKYDVAEKAYSEVINKGNNSDFYDKALYKRGWSFFKLNLFDEAQTDFFVLYERLLQQQQSEDGGKNNRLLSDLILDTQRVISLSFYSQDGAETIKEHFDKNGSQPYEDTIYAALANLYIEQERFQDAADTYLSYIKRNPVSLSSPEFHSRVIDIYKTGGFPSLILPEKEHFVKSYGLNSAFWKKYSGKVILEIKPLLRKHLEDISTFYHAKAQQTKKTTDYLVAAQWYREILATFEDPQIDSKYRYALAEALFDGQQYAQAAKDFEIVAYQNPVSSFSRDAGYKALLAYQNVKHTTDTTELEKMLPSIQSGLKFTQTFPQDDKSPEILARVSEQQLNIQDIKGAIDSAQKLLVLSTKVTKAQKDRAYIIIANGLFDLKQYAQAEVAIEDLLKKGALTEQQRKVFRQRRVESIYQLAEEAKQKKEFDEAINLYLRVKALEPSLSIAMNAHYDAATLYIQTEKWQLAANLLESFRAKYPKGSLSSTIPEKLALVYENQKNWDKAASEYRNLAQNQKNPEVAREGFWRVAELYMKAGNEQQSINSFKHYVWTYPEPYSLAQEGRYNLVNLYVKTGDAAKRDFWRQKIVEFHAKSKSNNTRTTFLAAESKFKLSESLFNYFKGIKLKQPIAKTLKKKKEAMQKALNAYNAIGKYDVAQFTTAATHKVAQIYQVLSRDLMNSERPKGLNEDELEEYGFLLEDQALPFEDKAISFYEVNAQRTQQNIYDDAVKQSLEALKKLKPVQYDKSERLQGVPYVSF